MLLLKKTKYSDEKGAQSVKKNGGVLGVLNWSPVHETSMNSTNKLISGDKKGYASYLLEKTFNPNGT
jgi:neutral ceramidase